jgi:nucleotide-binding universal stress UspA family protein
MHMSTTSERRSVASAQAEPGCNASSADPVPVDDAPLVVGFDGSTPATAALRWAAGTSMPVIIVRVVAPRPRPPGAAHRDDDLRVDDAALVLGDHAAVAARRLADCAWRAELVEAFSPAAGLAAAAHHHGATAIVVGSHGHGGGHTALGNQLHELLAKADAPVVVVPAQAAARLLGSGQRCAVTEIAS